MRRQLNAPIAVDAVRLLRLEDAVVVDGPVAPAGAVLGPLPGLELVDATLGGGVEELGPALGREEHHGGEHRGHRRVKFEAED